MSVNETPFETVPEHARCPRCNSSRHYLTLTNLARCQCDERLICARCFLSQATYWEKRAKDAEAASIESALERMAHLGTFFAWLGHYIISERRRRRDVGLEWDEGENTPGLVLKAVERVVKERDEMRAVVDAARKYRSMAGWLHANMDPAMVPGVTELLAALDELGPRS